MYPSVCVDSGSRSLGLSMMGGETRAAKGSTSLGRFWWLPQLTWNCGAIYLEKSNTHTHRDIHICICIYICVCLEGLSYASRLEGFCVIPKACCKSGGNAMVSADWLPFCESILSLKDGTSSLSGTGMEPPEIGLVCLVDFSLAPAK